MFDSPIVQISLDLTNLAEAIEMAEIAVAAGVDWLEAGNSSAARGRAPRG
jgi:3-keto-L-gulonate-6-phosphate decarboxylase